MHPHRKKTLSRAELERAEALTKDYQQRENERLDYKAREEAALVENIHWRKAQLDQERATQRHMVSHLNELWGNKPRDVQ